MEREDLCDLEEGHRGCSRQGSSPRRIEGITCAVSTRSPGADDKKGKANALTGTHSGHGRTVSLRHHSEKDLVTTYYDPPLPPPDLRNKNGKKNYIYISLYILRRLVLVRPAADCSSDLTSKGAGTR